MLLLKWSNGKQFGGRNEGMEWTNGMEWNEWNGMEWNGTNILMELDMDKRNDLTEWKPMDSGKS